MVPSGDGGDNEMVAQAPDGKWIYLFRSQTIPDVAGIKNPHSDDLIKSFCNDDLHHSTERLDAF